MWRRAWGCRGERRGSREVTQQAAVGSGPSNPTGCVRAHGPRPSDRSGSRWLIRGPHRTGCFCSTQKAVETAVGPKARDPAQSDPELGPGRPEPQTQTQGCVSVAHVVCLLPRSTTLLRRLPSLTWASWGSALLHRKQRRAGGNHLDSGDRTPACRVICVIAAGGGEGPRLTHRSRPGTQACRPLLLCLHRW